MIERHTHEAHAHHAHGGHDLKTTYGVFVALLVLLVATVGVAYLELGAASLAVAVGIAVAKALLILVYFMHLAHETPLVRLVAASGFVSLAILFAITFSDYVARSTFEATDPLRSGPAASPTVDRPVDETERRKGI